MGITYDDLGPMKVLHLYSAKAGLRAMVVVDNTALSPSIDGVRISPQVTIDEIVRCHEIPRLLIMQALSRS